MSRRSKRSLSETAVPEFEHRVASYPPSFPEGWYVVAKERDIGREPVAVRLAEHELVLFRGAEGRIHAIDRYCPHLGANLADGDVCEGHVQCPFHGWRLDGDGQVTHTREGERHNPNRRVASWAVDELYGWVCVYHRRGEISNEPAPKPPYQIQRVAEIDSGEMIFRGEHDEGIVKMHLIEFAENSVDVPHFETIHGKMLWPWTNIRVPFITIKHIPSWTTEEAEPHVAWFGDVAQLMFRGKLIPESGATATIRIDGPGSMVRFEFDLGGRGKIVMFQSQTPVAPLEIDVKFRWWSEKRVPKWLASYVVGNWVTQWRQDVPIWERKLHHAKPMLTENDGPVMRLRRWYAQFYPDLP